MTVENLTNSYSFSIDGSTAVYSVERPDGPATVHSPATVDHDSSTKCVQFFASYANYFPSTHTDDFPTFGHTIT